MPLPCGCTQPCKGLHDPFVCRVVPAALLWFTQRKTADPHFLMPPGIVDAVLTQVFKYSDEFDRRGFLVPFCEFVHENRDDFFDAVYKDQVPAMHSLFCQLTVKST